MNRKSIIACGVSLSAMTMASAAFAQQAAAPAAIEEVVVTGSRVVTNGNKMPTPVTVVALEQLQAANPGPIAQALAELPALLASPNQGGQGPGAQAVINLRGIYQGRTLTLLDGHRQPNTGASGVDTNLIPSMLLKRIDIVTGGASAVYGSDAVTGVVNFVMDNNFNGVKLSASSGISTFGDDPTFDAGIALGQSFMGGRGHVEASYQHFSDPGIADRFDRAWGRGLYSMQGAVPGSTAGAGSVQNPWLLYSNSRFATSNFGGVINTGPLANLTFLQNGVATPFNHGTPTGSGGAQIGGDGGYFTTTAAFGQQYMDQGFGRLDYDFTDTIKGYVEFASTTVLNVASNSNVQLSAKAIGNNNAYLRGITLPTGIANPYNAAVTTSFNFSEVFNELDAFPAPQSQNRGTSNTVLAGLNGSFGKGYKWEAGYEHAVETTSNFQPFNTSTPRLYAAINAVVNPANGQVVCNAALVNPSVYGGCVPLNLFGPSTMNRAAFDWINAPSTATTTNVIDDYSASFTGSPISTWAGPVDMALSGEWRRQTYGVHSTALPTDPVSCVGIQFNCVASTAPYASSTANFPTAQVTVGEAAYEAQVPLLKDMFLTKSLSANLAARWTDYSTSGALWSWKLGVTWAVNDDLSIRWAKSRDIRAPTLANLFAPYTVGTSVALADVHVFGTDPVTHLPYSNNVQPTTVSQGNPKLLPELSDTITLGFIWTPEAVRGLSVSMDGYDIRVTQGINSPTPFAPATQLACENSGGTAPVCALYVRPLPFSNHTSANLITQLNNITVNTGGVWSYGIDTEVNYTRLVNDHRLGFRALVNYQPHLIYDLTPAPIVDVGGSADGVNVLAATPNLKGTIQVNYEVINNLTAMLQGRFRGGVTQNGNTVLVFVQNRVPAAWYADLNLTYKFRTHGADTSVFFNVRNLFNTPPVPWASTGGTAQIGTFGGWLQGDDPLGRYFKVGVSAKF